MKPFAPFRAMGRYGTKFMKKVHPDLPEKSGDAMFEYVGECNKRNPTGEAAFNVLQKQYSFAHEPMAQVRYLVRFNHQCFDFSLLN